MRTLSIVIPTYNESKNIGPLAERLQAVLSGHFEYEVIIVDDNSPDDTAGVVNALSPDLCFSVIKRVTERGLSSAVLAGIAKAQYPYVQVMDADLSHPPEAIPALYEAAEREQADIVVGSRYVKGGSTDDAWTFFRRLNSWGATVLALPLVNIKDPMAGFFLFRKSILEGSRLDPIGYKILLEIIVKSGTKKVSEVPIHFSQRLYGKSKLSLKEQLNYFRHVLKLYRFKLTSLFAPARG